MTYPRESLSDPESPNSPDYSQEYVNDLKNRLDKEESTNSKHIRDAVKEAKKCNDLTIKYESLKNSKNASIIKWALVAIIICALIGAVLLYKLVDKDVKLAFIGVFSAIFGSGIGVGCIEGLKKLKD